MSDDQGDYPWYRIVADDSLEQGDLLLGFEFVVAIAGPRADDQTYELRVEDLDVVVMTQSCDLDSGKAISVVLCPVSPIWEFVASGAARRENWGGKVREQLRQGNLPGYHLLNECRSTGHERTLTVVDFRNLRTAPVDHVRRFVATRPPRLRLCPPYREHMAQAFARFFMRVGLPLDISRELLKRED